MDITGKTKNAAGPTGDSWFIVRESSQQNYIPEFYHCMSSHPLNAR